MIALMLVTAMSPSPQTDLYTLDQALEAVRHVETGGCPDGGRGARGDGGAALGPWQIHKAFHQDASERDRTLDSYQRCLMEVDYSRRVVKAYWRRYARAAYDRLASGKGTILDLERVSRLHNGGPRAHHPERRKYTDRYWEKVRRYVFGWGSGDAADLGLG